MDKEEVTSFGLPLPSLSLFLFLLLLLLLLFLLLLLQQPKGPELASLLSPADVDKMTQLSESQETSEMVEIEVHTNLQLRIIIIEYN